MSVRLLDDMLVEPASGRAGHRIVVGFEIPAGVPSSPVSIAVVVLIWSGKSSSVSFVKTEIARQGGDEHALGRELGDRPAEAIEAGDPVPFGALGGVSRWHP